jgi:hypothetical protein
VPGIAVDGSEKKNAMGVARASDQVRRSKKRPPALAGGRHFASLEFAQYNLNRSHFLQNTVRTIADIIQNNKRTISLRR